LLREGGHCECGDCDCGSNAEKREFGHGGSPLRSRSSHMLTARSEKEVGFFASPSPCDNARP
jgi:hypothetical protein